MNAASSSGPRRPVTPAEPGGSPVPRVSVIVASHRAWTEILPTLESVIAARRTYPGPVQLLLVRDTPEEPVIPHIGHLLDGASGLAVMFTSGGRGSAFARHEGIHRACGEVLLFTDDDTLVPPEWITVLAAHAFRHGNCTGSLAHRNAGFWAESDERIDAYRVHATDGSGAIKFLSFPNMAIRRDMLPAMPFEVSRRNLADDVDLACSVRMSGSRICLQPSITVRVLYPDTFPAFLRRKVRHGRGVGWLRHRIGERQWRELGLGSTRGLYLRWIRLSWRLGRTGTPPQRVGLVVANLAYCCAVSGSRFVLKLRPATDS